LTDVGGVPEIVGGVLVTGLVTLMENAAKEALAEPSDTVMTMFEYVPALVVAGVPASCPVLALKLAQVGLLEIENVRVVSRGAVVVGVNL
jgi:hypothetical protein